MSFDQEKSGRVLRPLPDKETSPLNELPGIVSNIAAQGFDSLQATQQATPCGQHQYGGTMPIVAPAARVLPVVREVQL